MASASGNQGESKTMTDPDWIREHVKGLSDKDLNTYMRMAMRNGDNARVAIADMERERRTEKV